MPIQLTLDELAATTDLDLGTSAWMRVDQERIDAFADATTDRQWIHVDVDRARQSPLGGTIAHGYLLLSLFPRLLFTLIEFPAAGMIINYGLDKLRFLNPVPAGAEVRARARLLSAQPRSSGVLFRVRGEILLRDGDRRAVVADLLFLVQPPAAA